MNAAQKVRPLARTFVLAAAVALVGACATPPVSPAKTTVVLLPDEDGNVGMVTVSGGDGEARKVDEAYAATVVQGGRSSQLDRIGQERVGRTYAGLLDAQPPKPKSFMLNFLLNKTVLTEESKAQIPAVMEAIRERKPTEITIFGHTDSSGSESYNLKLSAERARAIAALIRKNDPSLDHIDVQWFGAAVPLVKSESRKEEARNRRAEIQVL